VGIDKREREETPRTSAFLNSKLSTEIEAEVDLHLQHLFLDDTNSILDQILVLDYVGNGFERPGVTVLFGGNHGDKHCPISCKIHLSSPTVRKEKEQLSYQCPVVVFASVECSTDAYDLMNSTIMPMVKQQLKEIKQSSVVTVYHTSNMKKVFRSYTVPSTIRPGTIAFMPRTIEGTNNVCPMMTFSYGGATSTFGSVNVDNPIFTGIPYFELGAKVIISEFNEFFIGDLAFLAMLIGMNHSSGSHCLMCMMKGSEFNFEHDLELRTRGKLVECLEQYMLMASHPTQKAPPNYMGVNAPGLWDINPPQIIIPILHCPMGLVDKVLESFKQWVNLDVEDFTDIDTEAAQSVYHLAKQQHQAAIVAHLQAQEVGSGNPTNQMAKAMEGEANKARIKAKQAESKAKERYDEKCQRHNAKKSSLNQKFKSVF
jgi:hypothetical protein